MSALAAEPAAVVAAAAPLHVPTPPAWAARALADPVALLIDHGHCERKASASAMSLVQTYPEQGSIVAALTALAQEELRHLAQVLRLLRAMGHGWGPDRGSAYAQALGRLARHGRSARLVDRLLLGGLIEARSAERLGLLADAWPVAAARRLYRGLARSEAGHHRLFVDLAAQVAGRDEAQGRLGELAACEQEIIDGLPWGSWMH